MNLVVCIVWYIFFSDFIFDVLISKKIFFWIFPISKKVRGTLVPPTYGSTVKNLALTFWPKICFWLPYMYRNYPESLGEKPNVWNQVVTINWHLDLNNISIKKALLVGGWGGTVTLILAVKAHCAAFYSRWYNPPVKFRSSVWLLRQCQLYSLRWTLTQYQLNQSCVQTGWRTILLFQFQHKDPRTKPGCPTREGG